MSECWLLIYKIESNSYCAWEPIYVPFVYKFFDLFSHVCLFNLRTYLDFSIFLLWNNFRLAEKLPKKIKNTRNSYIPFIQIPQMLTFYHISSSSFFFSFFLSLHMEMFCVFFSKLWEYLQTWCPFTPKLTLKLELHHCITFILYLRKV